MWSCFLYVTDRNLSRSKNRALGVVVVSKTWKLTLGWRTAIEFELFEFVKNAINGRALKHSPTDAP